MSPDRDSDDSPPRRCHRRPVESTAGTDHPPTNTKTLGPLPTKDTMSGREILEMIEVRNKLVAELIARMDHCATELDARMDRRAAEWDARMARWNEQPASTDYELTASDAAPPRRLPVYAAHAVAVAAAYTRSLRTSESRLRARSLEYCEADLCLGVSLSLLAGRRRAWLSCIMWMNVIGQWEQTLNIRRGELLDPQNLEIRGPHIPQCQAPVRPLSSPTVSRDALHVLTSHNDAPVTLQAPHQTPLTRITEWWAATVQAGLSYNVRKGIAIATSRILAHGQALVLPIMETATAPVVVTSVQKDGMRCRLSAIAATKSVGRGGRVLLTLPRQSS